MAADVRSSNPFAGLPSPIDVPGRTSIRERANRLLTELTEGGPSVGCLVLGFRGRTVMIWLDDHNPVATIIRYLRAGAQPAAMIWWDGKTTTARAIPNGGTEHLMRNQIDQLTALVNANLSASALATMIPPLDRAEPA